MGWDVSTLDASQRGPMLEDNVELTASASEDEAVALSTLLNWFGFRDVRQYAVDDKDARAMLKTCATAEDGTTRAPWVRGQKRFSAGIADAGAEPATMGVGPNPTLMSPAAK
jgi:hypothetical protein